MMMIVNNDVGHVGHDDTTVKISNCQIQPKEAPTLSKPRSKSKKCNLCHLTELDADILDAGKMINIVVGDVAYDDATVQTSNCQMHRMRLNVESQMYMMSKLNSKKCALCQPTDLDADIFDEYYFCDNCLSQL